MDTRAVGQRVSEDGHRWTTNQATLIKESRRRVVMMRNLILGFALFVIGEQFSFGFGLSGKTRPRCKVLLLVAHADDEIIWAGEALLGWKTQVLCDAHWHIVTATFSSNQRVKEFWAILDLLRSKTLAAKITAEVWDYDDCNHLHCDLFKRDVEVGNPPFKERLIEVFQRDQWDYVITHNQHGEYHHKQHMGLYMAVDELFQKRPDVVGKASFWVFNPLPELNTSLSTAKRMLLQEYLKRTPTMARMLTFKSLEKYTEHLVPAHEFSRPPLLGVPFSQGLPFSYTFHFLPEVELTAAEIYTLLKEYFAKTWESTCSKGSFVRYPETCRLLRAQSHSISPGMSHTLTLEEVKQAQEVPIPSPQKGPASLRCLVAQPADIFGKITAWELEIESSGVYMELLALRPILVGWKQGKQNTYKILGSSGPIWVSRTSKYVNHKQLEGIDIQPHDVVGFGVFLDGQNMSSTELANQSSEKLCIGSRGCEKANFCSFDSLPPKELWTKLEVRRVVPHVEANPPSKPARRQKFFKVMEALDISSFVNVNTTYEELLTLRQRLDHPDLGIFEDKIRLRRELLPAAGVLATPSIHLSNDDFDIIRFLHGRKSYVVKPSHMSESQNVFVVHDGRNLLKMAWGQPFKVYLEEIQDAVNGFSKKTALEWECRALVSSKPGVIVEELVLANKALGNVRNLLVDEYKFFTSWGETIFAENVPWSMGTTMEISREGHILSAKESCPPICVPACYPQMVQIAEKVATYARTDFLRVDILISGDCEALYVSEVELFPASNCTQFLKDAVARRWRNGYGVS